MVADLHPQVRWTEAGGFPYGGTYIGPQAVIDGVFAAIGREWDSFGFRVDELLHAGETVVALGRYLGRYCGCETELDVRTAHVWRVTAGKVTSFEQFTDTALVVRAMQGEKA